jgi:hypothetical protein
MKGYVFDPSRLGCSPEEQERRGYELAARMLRADLGVDGAEILAEVRRRAQRDPVLRAMFAQAAADLLAGAYQIEVSMRERR